MTVQFSNGSHPIATKIIDIGDWNMDTTLNVTVSHGLIATNIRSVNVLIRDDADTLFISGGSQKSAANAIILSVQEINSTDVILVRLLNSILDNTNYDSTSYNRGWITIQYVV